MTSAADYKKLQLREQILLRPDTYIGATDVGEDRRWIFDAAAGHMVHRVIAMNPGLYKVFDEILVNARDAWVRGAEDGRTPVKHIDIVVDRRGPDDCTIRVSNDGDGIPIEMHPEERVYVGELIFGHLLTSSNYNDEAEAERITGGKNGFGAKLTNIYSRRFTVQTQGLGKSYMQTWRNNMSVCEAPAVRKGSVKGSVAVEWDPDFSRFPGGMSDDMVALFQSRVIELAACVGTGVKVSWNGETVATNNFEKFVKLFLREGITGMAYEACGPRWEVAAVLASQLYTDAEESVVPDVRSISFVNGINTRKGGNHVDYVVRNVLESFCEAAKAAKGKKRLDVKPGQIRNAVVFFVNATITNPAFDSQTKENMTSAVAKWGSKPTFSGALVDKLNRLGLLDEARDLLEAREAKEAKKTDGKKRSKLHGLPKLKDAIWAGTPKSAECTLILTEGDSAATSAISGLAVVGSERFGVFPLKGKLLNVKDISLTKFNANEELTAIKRILGLEQGKDYKDVRGLRYGRVMVMADQDHDGSHIKGLLMNLFHTEWPSLLNLPGFLCSLMTPILKASRRGETLSFYSLPEFEAWKEANDAGRGWTVKYYKGLGTSTPLEAREWFHAMNEVAYVWEEGSEEAIQLAFSKRRADDRKDWLAAYNPRTMLDTTTKRIAYERFVHDELIHFSNADNIRSLPSLMDGLKPSQRKILFGCFKRSLRSEIRVAQLAGYVSEHAAYHHGEASLNATIIGMAQNFVGANNLNLLVPNGQFGSRVGGGKDSASPRYIYTHLERIIDTLFRKEDMAVLKYLEDDGDSVEPEYYLPTVPLLAINGCVGIGTGFSTDVPSYDPKQIVSLLRMRLRAEVETLEGRQLDPWYAGFRGTMSRSDENTWVTHGLYEFNDEDNTITVLELPIGTWTTDYKVFLDELFEVQKQDVAKPARGKVAADDASSNGGKARRLSPAEEMSLESFVDDFNDRDVRFVLKFTQDGYQNFKSAPAEFEKAFRLTANHKTTNMRAFDADGHITKYDCVGDMLEAYFERRYEGYEERKAAILESLEAELEELRAKRKFVQLILDEEIVINRKEDDEIVATLLEHDLPAISEPLEPGSIKAYEYLLRMRLDRLKASAIVELTRQVEAAEAAYVELEGTEEADLWLRDLDEFEAAWDAMLESRAAASAVAPKKKVVKRKGAGAGAK
jgi:DNA topoisomerase-2